MKSAARGCTAAILAVLSAGAGPGFAASPEQLAAGKDTAGACTPCHGPAGIAKMKGVPHIAGQPASYFLDQMAAYRSGSRTDKDARMATVAKNLTEKEIADLAEWYAAIRLDATLP